MTDHSSQLILRIQEWTSKSHSSKTREIYSIISQLVYGPVAHKIMVSGKREWYGPPNSEADYILKTCWPDD